jgi:hypothetical protein
LSDKPEEWCLATGRSDGHSGREATALINRFIAALAIVLALAMSWQAFTEPSQAAASGPDSPPECLEPGTVVLPDDQGFTETFSISVGVAGSIDAVCFETTGGHSGLIVADGTTDDGCYGVSGLGTGTVNVVLDPATPDCPAITHVDLFFTPVEVPVEEIPSNEIDEEG